MMNIFLMFIYKFYNLVSLKFPKFFNFTIPIY